MSIVSFPGSDKSQGVFLVQSRQSPRTVRRLSKSPVWEGVLPFNYEIQEFWSAAGGIAPILAESHLLCGENSAAVIVTGIWSCWGRHSFSEYRSLWMFPHNFIWPLVLRSHHQI